MRLILAGSMFQARQYAIAQGLGHLGTGDDDWRFVQSPEYLLRWARSVHRLILFGTWQDNPKWREILEVARQRELSIEQPSLRKETPRP